MPDDSLSHDPANESTAQSSERDRGLIAGFVDQLLKWRLFLLLAAVVLTGLAWQPAQQLTLERSIESLFAPDHPLLMDYRESKALFGGDEFVLIAWKQPDLLETAGLNEVQAFADKLNALPGINPSSTQTLSAVLQPEGMGFLGSVFMRIPAIKNEAISFAEGALIGADQTTTAIVLRLKPETDATVSRIETFAQIRQLTQARPYKTYVVGEPVQVHDMFEIVEDDGLLLGRASSGILLVIMLLLFRSVRWMLLPIVIVQVSLLWTRALLVLTGLRLSMVSSMLDSLVTIIGIATVMHITITYRSYRKTLPRELSVRRTLIDLLPAIGWTCGTTAVGFGALMSSEIVPIQSFGLMMSIGTLLVLLTVVMIVPAAILLGSFSLDPRQYRAEKYLVALLQSLLAAVFRFPRTIGVASLLLTCAGLVGVTFLKIETDFSKNFHDSSPIAQSLKFVESNLGGAGNYEVNFAFTDLDDPAGLDKLRGLANDLRHLKVNGQPALTKVIAYTDGIDFIPTIAARTLEQKREFMTKMQPEFVPSLYNQGDGRMRILLRALERLPAEQKLQMIDQVQQTTRNYFPDAKPTGLYLLLANIIQSLLSDQLVSFSLAAMGIFLMMSLAFRSWLIGLISLVPNLFPIILLIGGLGWVGSLVNIGTAMIASVSIGLTVDSSIHYLAAYRRFRSSGQPHQEALRLTQGEVGISLVFANIALICGFSVLLLSEFVPLNYFGLLVSIAMLGGLLGNIVLLPLLLTWREHQFVNQPLPADSR